ncbi:unnamed protein product [Cuscuta epithymum]|uniref:Uncharacterized protein n=1 Tax=Cuscuta epithymum TaxID=186058 RepID=A0AAV0EMK0_9ASTE|nr:unnamed protein product [Cuscuta epithymum]
MKSDDLCCDFRKTPPTVLIISLDWMIQITFGKLGWIEDFIIYNFHEGSFVKFGSSVGTIVPSKSDTIVREEKTRRSYCQPGMIVPGGRHDRACPKCAFLLRRHDRRHDRAWLRKS